jgi:hypothetical protein
MASAWPSTFTFPAEIVLYPVLLALSAYRKKAMIPGIALSTDIPPTIEHGHTDRLVEHGYAHVLGDVRGSGEGRYTLWGRKEQEDCYDLIEWVAQQPTGKKLNVKVAAVFFFDNGTFVKENHCSTDSACSSSLAANFGLPARTAASITVRASLA